MRLNVIIKSAAKRGDNVRTRAERDFIVITYGWCYNKIKFHPETGRPAGRVRVAARAHMRARRKNYARAQARRDDYIIILSGASARAGAGVIATVKN